MDRSPGFALRLTKQNEARGVCREGRELVEVVTKGVKVVASARTGG